MQCAKCGDALTENTAYEFKGAMLCDDCYMDVLIGVPEPDVTKLPPEVQADYQRLLRGWNRHRPNRHHYLKYPEPGGEGK